MKKKENEGERSASFVFEFLFSPCNLASSTDFSHGKGRISGGLKARAENSKVVGLLDLNINDRFVLMEAGGDRSLTLWQKSLTATTLLQIYCWFKGKSIYYILKSIVCKSNPQDQASLEARV